MSLQSAAIPYRYDADGEVQVLLVTSRKRGKWILPKGNVRPGMAPHSCAAREAFEEGGVIGRVDPNPIAIHIKKRGLLRRTAVYALAVTTEAPIWPEKHERKRRWVSLSQALSLTDSRSVQHALRLFSEGYAAARQ